MKKNLKIALLSGGVSSEREVSLSSGKQILKAFKENGYEVLNYDPKNDLPQLHKDYLKNKFDIVFPALHGAYGEDGKLQGWLETYNIPYIFSGVLASSLAMDKYKSKIIAKNENINTAKCLKLSKEEGFEIKDIIKQLGRKIVIKPVNAGSSVGISICKSKKEIEVAIKKAFKEDKEVLAEEFVRGREMTVTVLGRGKNIKALPVIEIVPKISGFYDYKAKYAPGGSKHICPANIEEKLKKKLRREAVKIFRGVGCKDLARVDFIIKENQPYFLEINTIPGMTETSLVPEAGKAAGLEFINFLEELLP